MKNIGFKIITSGLIAMVEKETQQLSSNRGGVG
jgi:hypothetical protein